MLLGLGLLASGGSAAGFDTALKLSPQLASDSQTRLFSPAHTRASTDRGETKEEEETEKR